MNWRKRKLVEICNPRQWKNLPISELTEDGYPVYGANGIIGKYKEYNHEFPTIAITCRGATCGSLHITLPKSYITSNAMVLDDLVEDVNQNFLYYALNKRGFSDVVSGSAQPQITREGLAKIVLSIPEDLEDQIRIANILSKAEALISQRKESLRLLDEFLKSTFLEMFGDPVMNTKGWDTLPMSKIGQFISGGTPSKEREDFWNGTFPWVSPKDMKVPYITKSQDTISNKVFEETNLKRIREGHLLIVVRGMILAHTFPTAINTVDVSINQDMKAIFPIDKLPVIFLKYCLDAMAHQVLALITTAGHGTKKLDTDVMTKILVPIPNPDLQGRFATVVEKTEGMRINFQASLQELENLYGSLSQRAFKGELNFEGDSLFIAAHTKDDYE